MFGLGLSEVTIIVFVFLFLFLPYILVFTLTHEGGKKLVKRVVITFVTQFIIVICFVLYGYKSFAEKRAMLEKKLLEKRIQEKSKAN